MNTENFIQNMCRTCMKLFSTNKKRTGYRKQSIHEIPSGYETSISIMELLQVIQPQIKIEISDSLPTQVCSDCIEKLLMCHEFLEMYKKVDGKLRKMLKDTEIVNSGDDFKEPEEETLEMIEDDVDAIETKYEFEIEQINIDSFEKEKKKDDDCIGFENESLHELSDETENKEPYLHNPNTGSSDHEGTLSPSWKKISPVKLNSKNLNNDDFLPAENADGSIPCQECTSIFSNISLWKGHMQEYHVKKMHKRKYTKKPNNSRTNQVKGNQFECKHCGKGFSKRSHYNSHMRAHTSKTQTNEKSYLCIECGKSFKCAGGLKTHMLRHKGEKTFQCTHCPKKFVCSSGLYGHMMVHTKERTYVCDICGSAFHMAYQLRKHNLYHDGIKNYQCEYCDMRFVTREKQRRHMRTHTGEKPYSCKYCERAFAQSNDCVKHLRQHLGDNVYQCELCPLRFPLARDLRTHFATHKDDDEKTRVRNLEARIEEERQLQIKFGCNKI